MYKALRFRNDIDTHYMCQEKEEENLPAFKTASIQRLEDYIKKVQRKIALSDQKQN